MLSDANEAQYPYESDPTVQLIPPKVMEIIYNYQVKVLFDADIDADIDIDIDINFDNSCVTISCCIN